MDESLEAFGIEAVLRDVIHPTMRRVGTEWERGQLSIGQEGSTARSSR